MLITIQRAEKGVAVSPKRRHQQGFEKECIMLPLALHERQAAMTIASFTASAFKGSLQATPPSEKRAAAPGEVDKCRRRQARPQLAGARAGLQGWLPDGNPPQGVLPGDINKASKKSVSCYHSPFTNVRQL